MKRYLNLTRVLLHLAAINQPKILQYFKSTNKSTKLTCSKCFFYNLLHRGVWKLVQDAIKSLPNKVLGVLLSLNIFHRQRYTSHCLAFKVVGVAPLTVKEAGQTVVGVALLMVGEAGVAPLMAKEAGQTVVGVALLMVGEAGVAPLMAKEARMAPLMAGEARVVPLMAEEARVTNQMAG